MERLNETPKDWERQVKETAVRFIYPNTPNIAGAVQRRLAAPQSRAFSGRQRLAWTAVLILLIVGGLMTVPTVRAAVWRILQAGAITIFVGEPTPFVGEPTPTAAPSPQTIDAFIFELAESVTLAEAQAQATSPLLLPGYPEDLGLPDKIYLQDSDWPPTIIMVWLDSAQTNEALLSLYRIEADNYAYKGADNIEMTIVNGRDAIWLEAPHYFRLQDGRYEPWLFVEGSVLIWWTDAGITYRLESGLSLSEARHIAESLQNNPFSEEE